MAEEYTVAQGKPGVARVIQVDPELAEDAKTLLEVLSDLLWAFDAIMAGAPISPSSGIVARSAARSLLKKHEDKL